MPVRLFYSYSHDDEDLRNELEKQLAALQRIGLIEGWHDRVILPGSDWTKEIDENLKSAEIVLALVSSSFIASDYCYGVEMGAALARHHKGEARVIPVILRSCQWRETPLKHLAALPKNGKAVSLWPDRDEAFNDVAEGIKRVARELSAKPRSPDPPPHPPGSDPKLWLDEAIDPAPLYADRRFAAGSIHAPSQLARPGEPLAVRFDAVFGCPSPDGPLLREVEVRVTLPDGLVAADMLGHPLPHSCANGIELHYRGPSRKAPSWTLRAPDLPATLQNRNVATDDGPLFNLLGATAGQVLVLRMGCFANKGAIQGMDMPKRATSRAKQRIIDRLKLTPLGEPTEEGEIVLCLAESLVKEVPE